MKKLSLARLYRFSQKFSLFKTGHRNLNLNLLNIGSSVDRPSLYSFNVQNFTKKPEKNDKKAKKEKEKDTINKEYQDVSVDEIKSKYKTKSDGVLIVFKEAINEIRVQRSNPKILDSVQVNIKGKKNKLADISNIMLKAANILAITPFDESHKDSIVKGIESSKLDVQITTEANSIIVTLGAIPDDMKTESLQKLRKLNDASKEDMKNLRHSMISEIKKLEKIIGQDEAKRIEKTIVDTFEKTGKQIEQSYKKKEEEIKSC